MIVSLLFIVLTISCQTVTGIIDCYACFDVSDKDSCNTTVQCRDFQSCYMDMKITQGETAYNLGCLDNQHCNGLSEGSLVGRQVASEQCKECCADPLCNKHLCEKSQATTPSVTSTPSLFTSSTSAVSSATVSGTVSTCMDDAHINCTHLNDVINICADREQALIICKQFCVLCDVELEQFYSRKLDQRMIPNTFLKNDNASSRIECSIWCHITPGCQDFTFYQYGCNVYGVSNNSQSFPNMERFVKEAANFTATTLPSGNTFTYAIIQDRKNHDESHSECDKLGSRLIHVNTVEKIVHLQATLNSSLKQDYWVDGYRESYYFNFDQRDNWYFSNGEVVPAVVWSDGYPNGYEEGMCIQLWWNGGFNMDDINCIELRYFICEK